MSAKCTWIVVTEPQRTRIFANRRPDERLHPIFGGEFAPVDSDILPPERPLATEISAFVEQAAEQGQFDRLVLTGTSDALSALRAQLGAVAAQRVASTLIKDLTTTPSELIDELRAALDD
jgi:hypothetical protein